MKKTPHVIWVCPTDDLFFRSKGAVRSRANSVLPKLSEQGLNLNVLIPFNPALLPKTKLSAARTVRVNVRLSDDVPVQFVKLTKGNTNPGIFMLKTPTLDPALESVVMSKAAIRLAEYLKKPVDIFHVFNWRTSILPLYIELEKSDAPLFKNARTFLNISKIGYEGDFAPTLLSQIGVPEILFHPEGIEFYGKISFLKTGLLFADGIGLIDGRHVNGAMNNKARTRYEGIFEAQMHKLRRWPSDRSVRAYMDAYFELLRMPKPKPLLASLLKRLQSNQNSVQAFIDSWGPLPKERYGNNRISFLVQAPKKAFAFWECNGSGCGEFGVVMDDINGGKKHLLARGLGDIGEFWMSVEPDREYAIELVGWTPSGQMKVLMRSPKIRTPRDRPSSNTRATLIDAKTKERFNVEGEAGLWGLSRVGASDQLGFSPGYSSLSRVEHK